jgi:putative peptidoglycan lipid II flippase
MALTAFGYGLAYLRDAGVAALFGASRATDAFFAGTFPAMLLYTIAIAGSFVPALIPLLAEHAPTEAHGRAASLGAACRWLLWCLLAVVITGEIFAEAIMRLLAPGFDIASLTEATLYFRLSLPMLLFLGPASVATAALNTRHRFLVPGLGSVTFSGVVLLSLLFAQRWGLWTAALGMVVGAAAQVVLHIAALPPVERRAMVFLSGGDRHTAMRVLAATLPVLAFASFSQGLPLIERFFASLLPGGTVSHFAYATKIYTLPISIVAMSFASVLMPLLAGDAARADLDNLRRHFRRAVGQLLLCIVPLSLCLNVLAAPLVALAFEHGQFGAGDSASTAALLRIYSLALLPVSLSLLFARAHFAIGMQRRPALVAAFAALLYIALALPMLTAWGAGGLAWDMVLCSTAGTIGLVATWRVGAPHTSPPPRRHGMPAETPAAEHRGVAYLRRGWSGRG